MPTTLFEVGGATIYVTATPTPPTLTCRFGGTSLVPGVLQADGSYACISPMHRPGRVPLDVSFDGFASSSPAVELRYLARVSLHSITPSFGLVLQPQEVLIRGTNFAASMEVQCVFGVVAVPARVANTSAIQCTAPIHHRETEVGVSLRWGADDVSADAVPFEVIAFPANVVATPTSDSSVLIDIGSLGMRRSFQCVMAPSQQSAAVAIVNASATVNGSLVCSSNITMKTLKSVEIWYRGSRVPTKVALKLDACADVVVSAAMYTVREPFIRIAGRFVNAHLSCSIDGGTPEPAVVVDAQTIECILPASLIPPVVNVTVLCAAIVLESFAVHRTLPPAVVAIEPAFSQVYVGADGSTISISGQRLDAEPLFCVFNGSLYTPVVVSGRRSTARCQLPVVDAPGVLGLVIQTASSRMLHATAWMAVLPPTLGSAAPEMARSGTVVTFSGSNLGPTLEIKYGSSPSVGCTVVSPNVARCPAPVETGEHSIALSTNRGYQFEPIVGTAITTTSTTKATIDVMTPTMALNVGGGRLKFTGAKLHDAADTIGPKGSPIECLFTGASSATVEAQLSADGAIDCEVPPLRPGDYNVSVTPLFANTTFTLRVVLSPRRVSMTPTDGRIDGTTTVAVCGDPSLPYSPRAFCLFGSAVSAATYANASCLMCVAPMQPAGSVVAALFLDDSVPFPSAFDVNFTYVQAPVLRSLVPSVLTASVATPLTLAGYSLRSSTLSTKCIVRSPNGVMRQFAAVNVSASSATCLLPVQEPASINVSVAVGTVESNSLALTILSNNAAASWRIVPVSGSLLGNYTIDVYGHNFPTTMPVRCRFGSVEGAGIMVAHDHVQCVVPSQTRERSVSVALVFGGAVVKSTLQFAYQSPPMVWSVAPSSAWVAFSSINLHVRGAALTFEMGWQCAFNMATQPAIHVSRQELMCATPRLPPGSVDIQVLARGQVFYTTRMTIVPQPMVPGVSKWYGWFGTSVVVTGTDLTSVTHCVFDTTWVEARSFDTNVTCIVPSTVSTVVVDVHLAIGATLLDKMVGTFTPISPLVATAVAPSALAIVDESSHLTVHGRFEEFDLSFSCVFGTYATTIGSRTSDTSLRCPIPLIPLGSVRIQIMWDAYNVVPSAPLVFTSLPPVAVVSAAPGVGGLQGGSAVHLQTQGLAEVESLVCVFGTKRSAGSYDEELRTVVCITPAQAAPARVPISLVVNHQTIASSLSFDYVILPAVRSVEHSVEATGRLHLAVSTTVTSSRSLWLQLPDFSCRAELVTSNYFACTSVYDGVLADAKATYLLLSVNGADFEATGFLVDLTAAAERPFVDGIVPTFARAGGAPVTVRVEGTGFDVCNSAHQGVDCQCGFGTMFTNATFVSSVVLECPAPPLLQSVSFTLVVNGSTYVPQAAATCVFEIVDTVTLTSAAPTASMASGGLIVTVSGTGFYNSLGCWFEAQIFVPAMVHNSSLLTCTAPGQGTLPKNLSVIVSTETEPDFQASPSFTFAYMNVPVVKRLWPPTAIAHAGTNITLEINSAALLLQQTIACQFDKRITTPASAADGANASVFNVSCALPNRTVAGPVTVDLVLNDQQVVVTKRSIQIDLSNAIAAVAPLLVPILNPVPLELSLAFAIPSTVVELDCVVVQAATNSTWVLPAQTLDFQSVLCYTPILSVIAPVTVALHLHGQPYTDGVVVLSVYRPPEGGELAPDTVPLDGGVTLHITGRHFSPSPELTCYFGAREHSPAQFISSTKIACITPPASLPGNATVGVAITRGHIHWLGLSVQYAGYHRITSVTPGNGPIAGKTPLRISGSGFVAATVVRCGFELSGGTLFTPATVNEADQVVLCTTPAVDTPEIATVALYSAPGTVRLAFLPLSFAYVYAIQILANFPPSGVANQTAMVDIHGMNFLPSVVCRVEGSFVAPAFYLSPSHVRCATAIAVASAVSPLTIEVSNNAADFVLAALLPLYPPVVASTIEPTNAPTTGGTPIRLEGANVGLATHCRFDRVQVVARVVGPTVVICIAPRHPQGIVTVELSSNRNDFTMAAVVLEYLAVPMVASVQPSRGHAGAVVSVHGSGFHRRGGGNVYCRFGQTSTVLATVISIGEVVCVVPEVALDVTQGQLQTQLGVEISLNYGVDFSANGVVFEYMPEYHVRALRPRSGTATGGTSVHIFGRGFRQSKQLGCAFGAIVTPAIFVSGSEIRCATPEHPSGVVPMSLVDAMHNAFPLPTTHLFEFTAPVDLNFLVPAVGATSGGTQVFVLGSHFEFSTALACRFDDTIVPGVFWNASCVSCMTPSHAAGSVAVAVSLNGRDFTAKTLVFSFGMTPVITRVLSRSGISPFGGDLIEIEGAGLETSNVTCVFDDGRFVQAASAVTPDTATCRTPPRGSSAYAMLYITVGAGRSNFLAIAYYSASEIWRVVPAFAASTGGAPLRLLGVGFNQSRAIACVFSIGATGRNSTAPATYISSSEVSCASPAVPNVSAPVEAVVSLTQFGSRVTLILGSFMILPPLQLHRVTPLSAYHTGGTEITVSGAFLHESSTLGCVFGTTFVPAAFVNVSTATCLTPAHVPGSVAFGVTNNGIEPVWIDETFTFLGPFHVAAITPATGAPTGTTTVTITGSNLLPTALLQCTFGAINVPMKVVSDSLATCVAPAAVDRYTATTVALSIGFKGVAPVATIVFTYTPLERIVAVEPSEAWGVGGTAVTATVLNLRPSANSTCWFGDRAVRAVRVTSTSMTCYSPGSIVGRVPFAVSSDAEAPASREPFTFAFLPTPIVMSVPVTPTYLEGGADLLLYGYHLSSVVGCIVGATAVPAFATETDVHCIAPAQDQPGDYTVALQSAHDVLPTAVNVTYTRAQPPLLVPSYVEDTIRKDRPTVVSVFPPTVGASGGTTLTVVGESFANTPTLVCLFGTVVVPATFRTPTILRCVTPRHVPSRVLLEVSNDGTLFSISGLSVVVANDAVQTTLSPTYGTAGTVVTICGNHFTPSSLLVCQFGVATVQATYISPQQVQCTAPDPTSVSLTHGRDVVLVRVSTNNATFASHGSFFTYAAMPIVTSVWPLELSQAGGGVITVRGFHFTPFPVVCVWGGLAVPAVVQSGTLLTCAAPSGMPLGAAGLQLSILNGTDPSPSTAVTIVPAIQLTWVSPPWAAALAGTTLVHVFGANFRLGVELGCLVDTTVVPAIFVNSSAVQCLLPPHPLGQVSITVTNNGVDYAAPALGFRFIPDIRVARLRPTFGLVAGQTPVFVQGINFLNVSELSCRFGDLVTKATYISPELLLCIAPSRVGNLVAPVGSVVVCVSANGIDFAPSTVLFEYKALCPRGAYCPLHDVWAAPNGTYTGSDNQNFTLCHYCNPGTKTTNVRELEADPLYVCDAVTGYFCPTTTDALLCPRGMYCPGVGNTKATACYPGTYQPSSGQPLCELCPVGYICPGYNNTAPTLCPVGFVCASLGLSHPVQLCPSGFYCNEGTWTLDPSELSPLRPYPCEPGTFCLGGVEAPLVIDWLPSVPDGATAAQTCTEGSFCLEGTMQATLCYPGHYCPPGTTFPLITPPGTFAGDNGAIAPMLCFPGTFAVFASSTNCQVCPAGYTCPGYGNYIPTICPPGTYRSLADSITCRLCPAGTWSPYSGLADISYCEPCPEGRVCGIQGMNNLTQSIICPSGYVCGEATTLEMQYMHECPAGYYCASETTVATAFAHLCPPGSICYRGTKNTESTRYSCPVGAFCPLGTADPTVKESQCPAVTTSLPGSNELVDCSIEPISVCDKDPTLSYYPQFSYTFHGSTLQYDSYATSEPTGEIQIVAKVLPVNASASAAQWFNGTTDVYRACPSTLNAAGGELLTVIGRNFLDTHEITCEFRVAGMLAFESVPATYVNTTRIKCRAPPVTLAGAASLDVEVHVANYGVHVSTTSATVTYSATATVVGTCGYVRDEEGPWPPELGWFAVRGLSEILFSFDLRHVPADMVYDEHFKIAISVSPSMCSDAKCNAKRVVQPLGPTSETTPCKQPVVLPTSVTSTAFQQHDIVNITMLALEDVLVKPEIHIVYGLFVSAADVFLNTTTVMIRSPSRAFDTEGILADSRPLSSVISFEEELVPREYTFVAVYRQALGQITPYPLNLPPRFSQLERGRVLLANSVAEGSDQPDLIDAPVPGASTDAYWSIPFSTLDTTIDMVYKYRETFTGLAPDNSSYDMANVILPYMPYFSHCRGYGRYMAIFDLLESDECELPGLTKQPATWERRAVPALPNIDNIVVVGPLQVFQEPVADYCVRELSCSYEEDLSTIDVNPRWFEAESATRLFEMVNEAVTFEQYLTGGALYKTLLDAGNSDIFVPVLVDRAAADAFEGGCTIQCFPRTVKLDIAYYQVSQQLKRIVVIKMALEDFDKDQSRTDYKLEVEFHPLSWLELIINFAFDPSVFIVLFNVIGLIAWVGCGVAWIITRLTTRISDPPKLHYLSYLSLIGPPPMIGAVLLSIPFYTIIGSFYVLLNGDIAFSITSNYPGGNPYWLLDNVKSQYMAATLDPALVTTMRHGRTGLCFLLLGYYCMYEAAFIFIPKTISISERAAEEMEEKGEDSEESLWKPTLWMRSSFTLASVLQALFLTVLVEFSFWVRFPDYLWYFIFIINLLVPIIDMAGDAILHDRLLLAPLKCATNVVFAMITMAAPDFEAFVIAFYILFGVVFLHRLYFEVMLESVFYHIRLAIKWATKAAKEVVRIVKFFVVRKKKLKKRPGAEGDAKTTAESTSAKENEKPETEEAEGDTVEPIVDFAMEYGMETLAFFFQPTMIIIMIVFRAETSIADNYNIRVQDLEFYCYFFVIIIAYQLLSDVFILHCLELFKGWKLYDYFVYCRYRYIQREKRWKGLEHNLDECIEESLRHLDQLCFSSQFHFMCGVQTAGILSLVLAIEIMVRNNYNMFGDPAALAIVPFMGATCYCVRRICLFLIQKLALYKLRHESTTWHINPEDEELDVPNWEELERIKGASHEAFLMNQRLTSETFRYKFLNYNRAWIIQQLPNILTPRTLRRARPYLITQFSKIISSLNPQVSDDEDDDSGRPRFGPVSLAAPSRDIIRLWLAKARRRLRLRVAVQPLINAARKVECENCLSRRQLQVELVIPLEVMGDKFDKAYPSDEFNVAEWKAYFAQHEKFKTLCLNCLAKQKHEARAPLGMGADDRAMDDADAAAALGFGLVELNAASRAIMLKWYRLGQDRVFGKTGKRRAVANVSDDEEEAALRGAKWANQPVHLNAASTAIALKWMVAARLSIKAKHSGKRIQPLEAAPKPKRKKPPTKSKDLEKARTRRK
ncbi:hypothetical protein ACHHYP_01279 [Achlya hypogyna]|uniref:IPT/TIG domain-containing protein n=1 Tax=Achlya hypogyna TaxID=1202772 RepID=A0A1V9Z8Z6_ACHHY|nr:hypothetical protein ACHHYP_01279 [Achlya hypogyna]